jgi:hypothetical protein
MIDFAEEAFGNHSPLIVTDDHRFEAFCIALTESKP